MKNRSLIILAAVLINAGCGDMATRTETTQTGTDNLPPDLVALVAPGQDVASARLLSEDN